MHTTDHQCNTIQQTPNNKNTQRIKQHNIQTKTKQTTHTTHQKHTQLQTHTHAHNTHVA